MAPRPEANIDSFYPFTQLTPMPTSNIKELEAAYLVAKAQDKKHIPDIFPQDNPRLTGTAIKHDQGKPAMSLLSRTALEEVAKVMAFGAQKYAAHNWRQGFKWSRTLDAASRHLYAFIDGEDKDPESGLSHLAHAMCCLMFTLEFEKTHPELDDRWKSPE